MSENAHDVPNPEEQGFIKDCGCVVQHGVTIAFCEAHTRPAADPEDVPEPDEPEAIP